MTSKILLVLGMHRSGTSVLTRVISLLGAALPKSLLGKNESNLRGHWESEVLIREHDQLLADMGSDWRDWRRLNIEGLGKNKQARLKEGFSETVRAEFDLSAPICVIKEPRICRFAGLYIEALEALPADVHSILTLRNPLEIAASLEARDGLPVTEGLLLWLTHMLEAEAATRDLSRSIIAYEDILKNPVKAMQGLVKSLPHALPYSVDDVAGSIENYVSPSLKRQAKSLEDLALEPVARGWIADSYGALSVLCNNPTSKPALATLDRVRQAYFAALEPLYTLLGAQRESLSAIHAKEGAKVNARYEAKVQAQAAEMEAAYTAQMKAQIKTQENQTKTAYQAPLADLQNEVKARKAEQEHLKSELTKAQTARDEAQNTLKGITSECSTLQDALIHAQDASLKVEANTMGRISAIITKRDSVQDTLNKTRAAVKAVTDDRDSLQSALTKTQAVVKTVTDDRDSVQNELTKTQATVKALTDDRDSVQSALTKTQATVKALTDERGSVQDELINIQKARLKAEAELKTAKAEHDSLCSEIEFMRDESGRLLSQAESGAQHVQAELALARETLGELYKGLDDRDKSLAAQTARIQNLQAEYDAILNSTAWKMTGGVRRAMDVLRGKKAPKSQTQSLGAPSKPARITYKK